MGAVYNTDEIELRVKNGDGANWIKQCAKDIETGIICNTHDASQGFNSFRKIIKNHFEEKIPSLSTNDREVDRHVEL